MAERAKHAFGMLENIDSALSKGTIDAYDILFVKDAEGKPYVGWIDKDGNKVICQDKEQIVRVDELPITDGDENVVYIYNNECYIWNGSQCVSTCKPADLSELEAEVAEKVDADEVENSYEKIKYEISNVPVGTIVDYRDGEIRIFCPADTVFTKQSVGAGGDANCYYATLNTYVYNDDVVGYKEHLGTQSDAEILNDFKTDKYGRKFQQTWLALAKYDETTGVWNYYGKNSTSEKYIGWDYRLDEFNADGVMIASDSVRISLSNEGCHNVVEPYYVGKMMSEVDKKIAEATSIEVVEF